MPENPEIVQPLTLLKEVAERETERIAAIDRALSHPQFYDGDIGADIRWLLSGYKLLRQHAKSHQRDYASLAAKLDKSQREHQQDRRVLAQEQTRLFEIARERDGANEMKAKFEQSAAEGWANYREMKVARDGLLSLVEMWQEVDRDESPTAGRYRALTGRRDTWLARHRAQDRRCEGQYPVPRTSPPRDEPFDVTYRCALTTGHDGPHRGEP